MGEEKKGIGLGARFEGRLVVQHIYQTATENKRFTPCLFEARDKEFILTPLRSTNYYRLDTSSGYERLYRQ